MHTIERDTTKRRRGLAVWAAVLVVAAIGIQIGFLRYRADHRSYGCGNLTASQCDTRAAEYVPGGVNGFATVITTHPDCEIVPPAAIDARQTDDDDPVSLANPDTCADLPTLSDTALITLFDALGAHPDLADQAHEALLHDWPSRDDAIDPEDFQLLMENRMRTLGAIAGGRIDAAHSRRTPQPARDTDAADPEPPVDTATMTVSAIESGTIRLANPTELEPFMINGRADWAMVAANPHSFATVIEDSDAIDQHDAFDFDDAWQEYDNASEWATGTSDKARPLTD